MLQNFMKKGKIISILGVMLAMSLVACGGNSGDKSEASSEQQTSQASSSKESKSSSQAHKHSYVEDPTQKVDPTCDQPGKTVAVCECGAKQETPIKALGHQWGAAVDVAAEGSNRPYKKYECERNNKADRAVMYEFDLKSIIDLNPEGYSLSDSPAGFIKFKSNGSGLEFSFNSELIGNGKLYLRGIMDHWDGENDEKTLFSGKDGNSPTEKDTTNLEIKVNDTALVSTNKAALNTLLPAIDDTHPAAGSSWSAVGEVEFASMAIKYGLNTVSYKRVDSYNLAVSHLLFVFVPELVA